MAVALGGRGADASDAQLPARPLVGLHSHRGCPCTAGIPIPQNYPVGAKKRDARIARGQGIYAALFDAAPSLQSLFKTPRAVMAMRFMAGLNNISNTLQDPKALKVVVETLGFQHLDLEAGWARTSGMFEHVATRVNTKFSRSLRKIVRFKVRAGPAKCICISGNMRTDRKSSRLSEHQRLLASDVSSSERCTEAESVAMPYRFWVGNAWGLPRLAADESPLRLPRVRSTCVASLVRRMTSPAGLPKLIRQGGLLTIPHLTNL